MTSGGTHFAVDFEQGSTPGNDLVNSGFMKRIPDDPSHSSGNGYHYCTTNDRRSMILIANPEDDDGFSTDFCIVGRGAEAYTNFCAISDPIYTSNITTDDADFTRCRIRF